MASNLPALLVLLAQPRQPHVQSIQPEEQPSKSTNEPIRTWSIRDSMSMLPRVLMIVSGCSDQ